MYVSVLTPSFLGSLVGSKDFYCAMEPLKSRLHIQIHSRWIVAKNRYHLIQFSSLCEMNLDVFVPFPVNRCPLSQKTFANWQLCWQSKQRGQWQNRPERPNSTHIPTAAPSRCHIRSGIKSPELSIHHISPSLKIIILKIRPVQHY